jgi:hypothetical protein
MNVMDAYTREFLKYCEDRHFFFFDQDDRKAVCDRLGIDNEKLDEIIEYAIDAKFCSFFDPYLPYYVAPTNSGLRALGLAEPESEVHCES